MKRPEMAGGVMPLSAPKSCSVPRPFWQDLLALAKPRIALAVAFTAAVGFVLAARGVEPAMLAPLVGTLLLAAGASALNQWQEPEYDGHMGRTRNRPLPAGRVGPAWALLLAAALGAGGFSLLAASPCNARTSVLLGAFALLWYNGIYTYLKRVSAFAVVPGALIGAIPPLIGWTAAGGSPFDPFILLVAAFFFIWQIPHFWLILLMVGDEYAQAGLPTLTRVFSPQQLTRITLVWMLATAIAGLVFPAFARHRVALPWALAIAAVSLWMMVETCRLRTATHRRAFMRLNLYALAVMLCLALSALLGN